MRRSVLGVSLLGVLSGCGVIVGGDKDHKPLIDTGLVGAWETDCFQGDTTPAFTTEVYRFDALGGFEKRTVLHNDAACKDEALQHVVAGSYEILGYNAHGSQAKQINYRVKDVLMRPDTEEEAKRLNAENACGRSDWKAGEDLATVSGACAGTQTRVGQPIYDIYEIEDDTLYVGKPLIFFDRADPDARPFKVNAEKPFFKL